jgi:GNAT superfamily N-acetyltransferase
MARPDLAVSRAIFSTAFGTFLGMPDPENFRSDRDLISTRWHGNTGAALIAELDGKLAGSNLATNWGSFAFFGPLTVRPDLWDRGIAKHLLAATVDLFDQWDVRDAGLFTFPQSVKHISLYQKFDFWPQFLTAILSKEAVANGVTWIPYSTLTAPQQAEALSACRALTDSIHAGLDVSSEITSVFQQNLGDTVLLWDNGPLDAFAVCHCGTGSEAGSDNCYVKFAAARSEETFERLLSACESLALQRNTSRVEAGVSTARIHAYRHLLNRGFRTQMQGVAMLKPAAGGYNREDVYIVDDWR